jgi:hypothetical protein
VRSGFLNDYAYALLIREWTNKRGVTFFAGYSLRSNEPYRNEGAASFGVVFDVYPVSVKPDSYPSNCYADWFKAANRLTENVWVDVTVNTVKRKGDLL